MRPNNRYDPANPLRRRWHLEQDDLFQAIFARFPHAREFSPCDCGLAAIVIPRECYRPDIQLLIDDSELRARAQAALDDSRYGFANYRGDDAVLVLAELA